MQLIAIKIHCTYFLQSQQFQVENIQKWNATSSICNKELQNRLDCTGLAPSTQFQGLQTRKPNPYRALAPTNQTPNQKFYPTTNLDLRLENSHPSLNESQTRKATNRICARKIQNRNWVRMLCPNYSTLGCSISTTKNGRRSVFFSPIKIPNHKSMKRNVITSTRNKKIQDKIN